MIEEQTLTLDRPMSWGELARALREEASLRTLLGDTILARGAPGCFWECSPAAPERDFRFVVLPSAAVARLRPDPGPFAAHFGAAGQPVRFDSLGGDARLIAPAPQPGVDASQLIRFLLESPPGPIHALWIALGEELEAWWQAHRGPLWVSTSGLGVSWLHLRLDSRPKYFTHAPYRRWPSG